MADIHDGPIFIDVGEDEPAEVYIDYAENSEQLKDETKVEDDREHIPEFNKKYNNVLLNLQTRRIRCPECKRYTAENEEKVQRHIMKVHRGENPFKCCMCDYNTYNSSVFEEHLRIHQGIKPFKCSKCPYRSVSKKNTKKHELIHRSDNPLKCTHCDFIARHSRSLLNHIRNHDISKKIKRTISEYKDSEDSKTFDFVACSKSELSQTQTDEAKKRCQKPMFTCAICSWSSRNRPKILLHLIHHPKQYIDETVIDVAILKKHGILN